MVLILGTRVQSRDEWLTRCKYQGFFLSSNLTDAAGGDGSFFKVLIAYSCSYSRGSFPLGRTAVPNAPSPYLVMNWECDDNFLTLYDRTNYL
jgi:hypothetical protein